MLMVLFVISSVCINEVMANPRGSDGAAGSPEDRNEFIEIYNMGLDSVDLYNWVITDFDGDDNLILFAELSEDSSCIIPPGGFALIMDPEYIDSGENYMPYGIPSCVLLRPENTTIGDGLTNNDSIALINPEGDTISTYYYPFNAGDGYSVERISPSAGDIPENWGISSDSTGSTPGFINSIYSPPDFSLDTLWVEDKEVNIRIKNTVDTILSGTVNIFYDKNQNREREPGELLNSYLLLNIIRDSVVVVKFSLEEEGVYLLGIEFLAKIIYRRARIGDGISNLVLNEVMFAPVKCAEWIELYNRSPYDYYLDSCQVDENVLSRAIRIPPGEYLVIADDSSTFFACNGNIPAPLLTVGLSLSNSGDTVNILDEKGFLIDRLIYNGNDAERDYTLERVNPNITSRLPSNWGESLYDKGTPGFKNSIYTEYRPEEISLSVYPRHFSPNGDCIDERCLITFRLPYLRNEVTIRIYDRRGHLMKEERGVYGGEKGEWIWDGRDRSGGIVKTGLYIIFLLVNDMNSENLTCQKAVVSVER